MTERQFAELRPYADGGCIDMGYRPLESVIRNGWLREVVRGCWEMTPRGHQQFEAMVRGKAPAR